MKDVPLLARWLFPSTIKMLKNKIEVVTAENYKLKRRLIEAEMIAFRKDHVYQYWTNEDWEKVYGKTNN